MAGPAGNQTAGGGMWSLGTMSGPVNATTALGAEWQWKVTVPAVQLRKAGKYTLFVFYKGSLPNPPAVQANGSSVTIYPGLPYGPNCTLAVNPVAITPSVGDSVNIDLALRDMYGNPTLAARNVSVSLVGPISKRTIVAGANFTSLGAGSGLFRYVHVLEAREQLTVWLNVSGAAVASATLNVSAVSPSAIAFSASVEAAVVQLYGSTQFVPAAQAPGTPLQAAAMVGHRLEVPVLRSASSTSINSTGFGADPGLVASVELSAVTGSLLVFNGTWYGSNHSYVIFFRAPAKGLYTATVWLRHPTVGTEQASMDILIDATLPRAVNFSLAVAESAKSRVGDWVFVTPTLLSDLGQPAAAPSNLNFTARGTYSGVSSLPLQLSSDGIRFTSVRYAFAIQETVTFELAVAGAVVANATVVVQGIAPALLDLSKSLAAACLSNVVGGAAAGAPGSCSDSASSSTLVWSEATVLVQKGTQLALQVPIYTVDGKVWQSDPGLDVVLSLVPSALVDNIKATYASSLTISARRLLMMVDQDYSNPAMIDSTEEEEEEAASQTFSRAGRALLAQEYGSLYSGTQAYDYPAYSGEYASDNAAGEGYDPYSYDMVEEPPQVNPWPAGNLTAPPAPPLNSDSPDSGVSQLQDRLAAEQQVITARGTFSAYKLSYQLQLKLTDSDTYLALLSVRNRALAGSLRLTRFWLTSMDISKLSALGGNATSSTSTSTATSSFDPAVNPVVSINLTLPAASVASYPGGPETMLADYRSLLAARAGLPSTDNVVVSLDTLTSSSGSGGSGSVTSVSVRISFQVYFSADWAGTSSSFSSMTSLEWFYYRLTNLPAAVLQDKTTYPSLDASVVQVTAVSVNDEFVLAVKTSSTVSTTGDSSAATQPIIILSSDLNLDSDPAASSAASSPVSVASLPAAAVSSPPTLTMLGVPYVTVVEQATFNDPGVYVYDAVDGFNLEARVTVRVCARKANLEALMYALDAAASAASAVGTPARNGTSVAAATAAAAQVAAPSVFTCTSGTPTSSSGGNSTTAEQLTTYPNGALTLNSSAINGVTQMYLLTYSAVNSRATAAAPRYRAVVVQPRCDAAAGEFWCASLSACSVGGVCSSGLARLSTALQQSTSVSTSSTAAAASVAAASLPGVDPSSVSVISSPDGGLMIVSPDGSTTTVDPLSYMQSSLASSNSEMYGILGDIMNTQGTRSSTATVSAQQPVYVKDTLPPVITMLGSGQPALTHSSGGAVMIDTVVVGSQWSDPGATVWDAVDGDLTALLQTYGAAAVDTSRPTKQGSAYSYMVEYQAEDLTGNIAQPARRLVRLVCPSGESYCTDADDLPACTVGGVCGDVLASDPTQASSAGSTIMPSLRLVGPSEVWIQQGAQYDRCTTLLPQDQPCDPGVVASDTRDGSLDLRVQVCGTPLRASRAGQLLMPLLLACNATTATPANYTITYSVANSAGRSVSTLRTVVVQPACPAGERLCAGGMVCSEESVCKEELRSASAGSGSTSATAATSGSSAASSNKPVLTLITAAAAPAIVELPRGSPYKPCAAGADLTAASTPFCEPGATARDSSGNVDMSDRVVVCPPSNCLYRTNDSSAGGCSSDLLRRHTLAAKGLAGCGLNTAAPPGAVFNIDFWVWDDARPPYNATVRRTIIISDPCTDKAAPYFCSNGAGGYMCSPSPCAATASLLPPAVSGPNITLLPSAEVVYVQFGAASPIYLGPCASSYDTRSCGSVATGVSTPTSPSGSMTAIDLTAQLGVINTTPCNMTTSGSSNATCLSCSVEALAVGSGSCLPGVYTYRYSVTDDQGVTATANRTVVVYQQAVVSATLTLLAGKLTDAEAASDLAINLLNSSHPDFASAVQEVVARMSSYGVQASDVDILSAAVSPATPPPSESSPASMVVNVAIHLFNPRRVHRASTGLSLAASGRRRRQLTDTADFTELILESDPWGGLRSGDSPVDGQLQGQEEAEDIVLVPLAEVWAALRQQQLQELQQQRQRLVRQLEETGRLDRTCRETDKPTTLHTSHAETLPASSYTVASASTAPDQRLRLRSLLQTSGSSTPLSSLASSVASSLNATSTNISVPASPDLLAGYTESLVGLAQALLQMSAAFTSDATALATNVSTVMGDTYAAADVARDSSLQSALSALLAEFMAADNRTLVRAAQVESGLSAIITAEQQVLAQAGELELQFREVSAATRGQTDRALYMAMVIAEANSDPEDMVMDPDCYRLQLTGFRANFTVSRSSSSASASGGSNATANGSPASVGGRRRLQESLTRTGSGSSSSGAYALPWLGYVLTRGTSSLDAVLGTSGLDVGAELSAVIARPRFAGPRIANRVVGGLLLHTTRCTLRGPAEAGIGGTGQDVSSCNGSFSDLDASCHWFDVAFMYGNSTGASYLKRLYAGTNNSVAPYGVDPVFLRSSALYREDLAPQLSWYYNTSDPEQVSATGTPFGFTARPLAGRTPGFPVLLEGGLSAGRAAAMIRYLADGNYLDHRQTVDLTAELLAYNPGLRAFAYFRAAFTWSEAGAITGRLSTVGFPAMTYLKEDQPLAAALTDVFAKELLPLWTLAVFFAVVTIIATANAGARAARYAAAAAEAAAKERALANVLKALEAPLLFNHGSGGAAAVGEGTEGDLASGTSESAETPTAARPGGGFANLVAGATSGAVPWAHAGAGGGQVGVPAATKPPVGGARRLTNVFGRSHAAAALAGGAGGGAAASHIRILRDEVAERREERLDFLGASNFSERRAWFREFVRHDGGLLYDIPLALLLIGVAAFWTVFVEQYLVLYTARSSYRVYDASASAAAHWLSPARTDPGSATQSPAVYGQSAGMGIDVPSDPGDPGRWLLPTDDSDWDALNDVLQNAHSLVDMWTAYGMVQAVVIVCLIAKLVMVLAFQARLGIICRTLMTMFGTVAHLVIIIVVAAVMVAAAANIVMGDYDPAVSSISAAISDTMKVMLGPGAVNGLDLAASRLIMPSVLRVAGILVMLTKVLLLLFVLFNFFFAGLALIFMKQKHSVDWAHAATVPQDLARVVLPDLLRRVVALMPGAAAWRRRHGRAAAATAPKHTKHGDAQQGDLDGTEGAAPQAVEAAAARPDCTPSCDGLDRPSNKQLLRGLAAGGVHELMCASELPKTWNGRVRAAKVAGGRLLVDKASMRQLMGLAASCAAATAAKLPREDDGGFDDDGDVTAAAKRSAVRTLEQRQLALTVARRVMERVGRTYGSLTPEYRILEKAAVAQAAERRRSKNAPSLPGPLAGALGSSGSQGACEQSSGSISPPRRSLSNEIQVHLSIYDALNAGVESIVRWQSGVHRWQLRTWRQMAAAYLFNQQLLAGLGVAPGAAFVERPRALQDEDLPHTARESQTSVQPSTASADVPPLRLVPRDRQVSWLADEGSGVLSPSQLSMAELSRRGRASDSMLVVDPTRWASRTSASGWPGLWQAGKPPTPPQQQQQQPKQGDTHKHRISQVLADPSGQRQSASLDVGGPQPPVGGLGGAAEEDDAAAAAALAGGATAAPSPAAGMARDEPASSVGPGPAALAGSRPRGGTRSLTGVPISSSLPHSPQLPTSLSAGTPGPSPSSGYVPVRSARWLHVPAGVDGRASPSGAGPGAPPASFTRGQSYSHAFAMVPEEEPDSPEMQSDSGDLTGLRTASAMAAAGGPTEAPKGLPSARNRRRWGGVAPMVEEMRERLAALMHRRSVRAPASTGETGSGGARGSSGSGSGGTSGSGTAASSRRSSAAGFVSGAGGQTRSPAGPQAGRVTQTWCTTLHMLATSAAEEQTPRTGSRAAERA